MDLTAPLRAVTTRVKMLFTLIHMAMDMKVSAHSNAFPHSASRTLHQGPEACGTVKPANVISTSYSYNEADLSPFYTARQCAEYAKLGLMGITILYSSGDDGVAGNGDLCLNPNGWYASSPCPCSSSVLRSW